MINYIHGSLISKKENSIVIECNHMGYEIFVPLTVLEQLPAIGSLVKIYTEMYVREDDLRLFGFMHEQDTQMFRQLIRVSGIGPKGALAILSTLSPDSLRFAIITEDAKRISEAKGIGKKTAEKLIIELKDSLKNYSPLMVDEDDGKSRNKRAVEEAVLGLTGLGYTESEALGVIRKVDPNLDTASILNQALKILAKE